jgi:acyl-CoA dehydrogenase
MKTLERAIPWTAEHRMYREMAAEFFDNEVAPNHGQWEKDRQVPREIWRKAGQQGLLCPNFPEEFGGAGVDFLYNAIVIEESARVGNSGFMHSLHGDVIAPYVLHYANPEQKQRWLPGIISGEKILAIGMTEPGTGSDLANIKTTAEDKGDHYVVNGSKTFISNGYISDLIITVAKTSDKGIHGISLLMVEEGMPGFSRGRKLEKIGLHAQDTSELSFEDVVVPKENLLGKPGHGFRYLMSELQQERLVLATANIRSAEAVLEETIKYVKTRQAFGQSIGKFQYIRFKLADMATEQACARAFLDQVLLAHSQGQKGLMVQASQCKLMCSELLKRHVDECLQFFGGYGYMMEYPIARAYLDARVQTIYAGTSEIMREIIAGSGLGL